MLHHGRLEGWLVEDAAEDVGVVIHAADNALDEDIVDDEAEVLAGKALQRQGGTRADGEVRPSMKAAPGRRCNRRQQQSHEVCRFQ